MIGDKIKMVSCLILVSFMMFSTSAQAVEQGSLDFQDITKITGVSTFVLFALATLILPITYLHRFVRKNAGKNTTVRKIFRSLKPFSRRSHLIIGVGALILVTFHAYLAIEGWNIFLILGLMMVWINILPGLFYYSAFFDEGVSRILYKVHVSIIFRVLIIIVLYAGHMFVV